MANNDLSSNINLRDADVVYTTDFDKTKDKKKSSFLSSVARSVGKFQKQKVQVSSRANRKGVLPATRRYAPVAKGVAKLFGAPTSARETNVAYGSKKGRGRPRGSYKYGTISAARLNELRKGGAQTFEALQRKKVQQLVAKGYSYEDANRIVIMRQNAMGTSSPQRFKQFVDETPVSANTVAMLERLREVQQKAVRDDFEQQRRMKERRMVAEAGNLLKARNLFGPDSAKFDILETEGNILQAPNTFLENPENNILRPRGMNILNTKEAGNSLFF